MDEYLKVVTWLGSDKFGTIFLIDYEQCARYIINDIVEKNKKYRCPKLAYFIYDTDRDKHVHSFNTEYFNDIKFVDICKIKVTREGSEDFDYLFYLNSLDDKEYIDKAIKTTKEYINKENNNGKISI